MKRGAAATAAALAAALLLMSSTPAAAAELVTVTPADLVATLPAADSPTFVVPFTTAEEVSIARLRASAVDVRRDGAPTGEPDAVEVFLNRDVPALRVRVLPDRLTRTGTYTVSLALRSGNARQFLTMTLTRPAATLSVPASVAVERDVWFPELSRVSGADDVDEVAEVARPRTSETLAPLVVRNASDQLVRSLQVTALDATADGIGLAENVELDVPIDPRGSRALDYGVVGDPPLGSVTRSLEITSPQLSAPVTVTFAIETRRHPALIGVLILLGLVLGSIVRKLLPYARRQSTARADRARLRTQFAGVKARYDHANLVAVVQKQEDVLDDWPQGVQERERSLQQAKDAVEAAMTSAKAEVEALRRRADGHAKLLERTWLLTGPASRRLRDLRAKLPGLRATLDRWKVTEAEHTLDELDHGTVRLTAEIETDRARFVGELQALQPTLVGLGPAFESVGRTVGDLLTLATEEATTAAAQLGRLHQLNYGADVLGATVNDAAGKELSRLRDSQREEPAKGQGELAEVITAAEKPDPHERLSELARTLSAFAEAVRDDVLTRPAELQSQLAATPATRAELPELIAASRRAPPQDRLTASLTEWSSLGLNAFVDVVRSAVLAALLVAVAYGWLLESWTGTAAQMTGLVIWAFGIDLTVELVTRTAQAQPSVLGFATAGDGAVAAGGAAQEPAPMAPSNEAPTEQDATPEPTPGGGDDEQEIPDPAVENTKTTETTAPADTTPRRTGDDPADAAPAPPGEADVAASAPEAGGDGATGAGTQPAMPPAEPTSGNGPAPETSPDDTGEDDEVLQK